MSPLRTLSLALAPALLCVGCAGPAPELTAPQITLAPYESPSEVLWAVAPLRNESGTSAVDPMTVSDKLVAAAEEIRGVRCLPLNRTLETMRALKMPGLATPGDIAKLAQQMGVDGLLVGSVTAYDPYTPSIGLSLVLWAKPGSAMDGMVLSKGVDPRTLQFQARELPPSANRRNDGVVASVSEFLDGKNHQVLLDVRNFASGRSKPTDALNWKRYVASMPLFEEFAANYALSRLMHSEWIRLGRQASTQAITQADDADERGMTPQGH